MSAWPHDLDDVQQWSSGENAAAIGMLGPRVIGLSLAGTVGRKALAVIDPALRGLLTKLDDAYIFVDAKDLDGYEGELRDGMIAVLQDHRRDWVSAHVLFESTMLGMVVSTVGLIFGGALVGYRDQAKFTSAIEQALDFEGF